MDAKQTIGHKGQAAIETAFALPFLIFLIYWTMNAYSTLHTAHVGAKHAATNLYQRLNNRAKFVVDDVANTTFDKEFMAVEYRDSNDQTQLPKRTILFAPASDLTIDNIVGICREPGCR